MAGLNHALALNKSLDQRARERFTSSMRAWVLTDLAGQMQADYNQAYEASGTHHDSGEAVHQFLKDRGLFKWYSSCLLYTSPSPRDKRQSRMPSSA